MITTWDRQKQSVPATDLIFVDQMVTNSNDRDDSRGTGRTGVGMSCRRKLAFREGQLRKIREAKAALEAGARAEAEQAESEGRITLGCLMTRRSGTSPTRTPA